MDECRWDNPWLYRNGRDRKETTLGRLGGVADPRELGRCAQSPDCIVWRAVRVRLTAPTGRLAFLRHSRADSRASKSVIRKDEPASEVGKRGKGRERPGMGPNG